MPTISVIVPVYNQEKYLHQCVDSLLCQTFSDLEIILVDDGSTDRSGTICDDYAKQDERISVIHKSNGGLSDARNAGIEIASGDYFAFVDSDDFVDMRMYEFLLENLKEERADLAICGCLRVDEQGQLLNEEKIGCTLPKQVCDGRSIINQDNIDKKYYWLTVVAWNKLYKRELFETLRYPKGKYHEDEFIFHELYAKVKKVTFISAQMYYYRQRAGSIMCSGNLNYSLDRIEALYNRILFCIIEELEKAILSYEKIMFMDLEKIFKNNEFCKMNRKKVNEAKRMEQEITEKLYDLHLISYIYLLNRRFFCRLPKLFFLWKRVTNKIRRMREARKRFSN